MRRRLGQTMRQGSGAASVLLLASALLLTACSTSQKASVDLPKLSDIRPERPIGPPEPVTEQAPSKWVISVVRMELPLDVPTNALWGKVDENAVSDLIRAVWQRNGLRLGVMDPYQLSDLDAVLPKVVGQSGARYFNATTPVPVWSSPTLRSPVTLSLAVPPMAPESVTLRDGKLNLLVSQSEFRGGVALSLVPHHHDPRPSLIPRDPMERKLEGTVFEKLGARVLLQPGQYAVVGLYWPWVDEIATAPPNLLDEPADTEDASDTDDAPPADNKETAVETGTANTGKPLASTVPSYRMPDLARSLGTVLMTGQRRSQPVQVVLMISLSRVPQAPAAAPSAP